MKRRNKSGMRILAAFLPVPLLAAWISVPVNGETAPEPVKIQNEEEFLLLADQCRSEEFSEGRYFSLEADLDLSEYENTCVPVMNGFFEGNGHEIRGLVWDEEMSDYGLFRYIGEEGTVQNLTVEAEVLGSEEQEYGGIIAGSNKGTIAGCVSRGVISGQNGIGGIAGINEETGEILRSENEAQVDGQNCTGGIAGENKGKIEGCSNLGSINTDRKVKKPVDGDGSMTISIPNAVSGFAKDERANQTGGIAGWSSGKIVRCTNQGTIGYEHLGYETGGIAGRQSGSLSHCTNEGIVYGRKDVGGIVGYFEPFEALSYNRDYRQELEDELDELSSIGDSLSSAADRLGDHFSEELDTLTDQLKKLRNSVRGYLDNYEEMTEDGRDDIQDQVGKIKDTLDGMDYDFGMKKLDEHLTRIRQDMDRIREILKILKEYQKSADQAVGAELEKVIGQYEEELGRLQEELDGLKESVEAAGSGTESQEPEAPDASEPEISEPEIPETAPEEPETDGKETPQSEDSAQNQEETGNEKGQPDTVTPDGGTQETPKAETPETEEKDSSGTEAAPESQEPAAGEELPSGDTGESQGVMTPMAFVPVTASGNSAGQAELAKLKEYIQELKALSADIRLQLQGILECLGTIPGQAGDFGSDLQALGEELSGLDREIGDILDDFGDELGTMKDDLKNQGNGLSDQLDHTLDTVDEDWDSLKTELDRMKDQFQVIRGTISDGFDELFNRIEDRTVYVDVSELLEAEPGEGVVFGCSNSGEVCADSQGGGIAGSITKVSTGDAADWFHDVVEGVKDEEDEDEPDSLTQHVQAAIVQCVNLSDIRVTNDYAGGVVGKASYGVIRSSQNYGDVQSEEGSYAGGIAGKAENGIYDCYVLCGVSGKSYVGGAAGRTGDLSGSYVCSYLDLEEDYVKCSGALAGKADGKVENNIFVDHGEGAVDGVTRTGEAEGMDYETLMNLPDHRMPERFGSFTVKFMDQDQIIWEKDFSYGDSVSREEYPDLPIPENGYVYWEEKALDNIVRNVTIHSVYRGYVPSLASDGEGEKSAVLLGGNFYPDSTFSAVQLKDEKEAEEALKNAGLLLKYRLKRVYRYSISQEEELQAPVTVRILKEDKGDTLALLTEDLELAEIQKAEKKGSYLSAELPLEKEGYLLVLDKRGW